jgi:hypothetical protein
VIRSDTLGDDIVGVERKLGGARVILCTLSTMSNFFVHRSGVMRLVPVKTVIVDEASQIEVGDYVPLIQSFSKTLRKLVFIGDDKQREHTHLVLFKITNIRLQFRHLGKRTSLTCRAYSRCVICVQMRFSLTRNVSDHLYVDFSPAHHMRRSYATVSWPIYLPSRVQESPEDISRYICPLCGAVCRHIWDRDEERQ